jgi:hypothetical protein
MSKKKKYFVVFEVESADIDELPDVADFTEYLGSALGIPESNDGVDSFILTDLSVYADMQDLMLDCSEEKGAFYRE